MKDISILQFSLARGIGEASIKKILHFIETNHLTWDEFASAPDLMAALGLKENIVNNVMSSKKQAEKLADDLYCKGIEILTESEAEYPQQLKNKLGKACPPLLFVRGNKKLLNTVSVGFCGSRKASEKGLSIAENCSKQLAERNVTVISGYATGTDLAAHKSAIEHGGNTVFVLAEGILRSAIKKEIQPYLSDDNHVFISQFMPNTTWNAGNAMRRNGTIIGLSRAMILVESGKTGGTFAAGEEALRVGCPLFVIDFSKPEVSAEANPYFIKNGGLPIRGRNGIPSLTKVFLAIDDDNQKEFHPNQLSLDL